MNKPGETLLLQVSPAGKVFVLNAEGKLEYTGVQLGHMVILGGLPEYLGNIVRRLGLELIARNALLREVHEAGLKNEALATRVAEAIKGT